MIVATYLWWRTPIHCPRESRFQFATLCSLAESNLFGRLHAVSAQEFAQSVPNRHWFRGTERTGGFLIENGVQLHGHTVRFLLR
jgi:hypothetical protein